MKLLPSSLKFVSVYILYYLSCGVDIAFLIEDLGEEVYIKWLRLY